MTKLGGTVLFVSSVSYHNSPEETLQLGVQVPNEGPPSYNLSMAVVECQTSVTHIFPINTLCTRGHTDDLSLLYICT